MRTVDLREYRPAAVLVIDLVKHSTRAKEVVYEVQLTMENVFTSVCTALALTDSYFNYTGDGYVCALAGDSSSRAIDFLNAAIPRLSDRLLPHGQTFRVGADFGLIHLRENKLTSKAEFFDSPSVVAARLEHSAAPGQILCSQRFRDIFKEHFPELFSAQMSVETKDRVIEAFEITPSFLGEIADLVKTYLMGSDSATSEISDGRKEIFVIDDEEPVVEVIASMIQSAYPNAKVNTYPNGAAALKDVVPGKVGLACVDLMMAELDGIGTIERLLAIDPEITVYVVTAVHDDAVGQAAVRNGAAYYLRKPFDRQQLLSLLASWKTIGELQRSARFMSEARGQFMWDLQSLRELRQSVLGRTGSRADRMAQMIRHRLKNSLTECAQSISAGSDLPGKMTRAISDLRCLERLSRGLAPIGVKNLCRNLRAVVGDIQKSHDGSAKLSLACRIGSLGPRLAEEIPTILLVVSELIQNALDATKGKGKIEVRARHLTSRDAVQITVKDSGPGVPKRLRRKMFQAGVSTKGQGRGLGLALVSDSVRSIGGEITYSGEPASIFRVVLPEH